MLIINDIKNHSNNHNRLYQLIRDSYISNLSRSCVSQQDIELDKCLPSTRLYYHSSPWNSDYVRWLYFTQEQNLSIHKIPLYLTDHYSAQIKSLFSTLHKTHNPPREPAEKERKIFDFKCMPINNLANFSNGDNSLYLRV